MGEPGKEHLGVTTRETTLSKVTEDMAASVNGGKGEHETRYAFQGLKTVATTASGSQGGRLERRTLSSGSWKYEGIAGVC